MPESFRSSADSSYYPLRNRLFTAEPRRLRLLWSIAARSSAPPGRRKEGREAPALLFRAVATDRNATAT